LQNTAIESDDTHPQLRYRAQRGLQSTLDLIKDIIDEGIQIGEFKEDLDVEALASFTYSLLEGGIMISNLEGNMERLILLDSRKNYE
jgi:TetR/AcrR family transcriptional repressor of nem operon